MQAGPGLAQRTVAAHRRRQRRFVAVTAVVAALVVAGGTSLAVTLTGTHHNRSVLATNNASPSPSSASVADDVCGAPRPGERSIVPTGGSPYLAPPPVVQGPPFRVSRAAALTVVSSGPDGRNLLKHAPLQLQQVRTRGLSGACEPKLVWIIYGPSASLSAPNGDRYTNCVTYFLVDTAGEHHFGGESTVCIRHPWPACAPRVLPPTTGGGPRPYGQAYQKLPPTAGTWTKLPNSPLSTRSSPVVVWAGNKLIVWAGQSGPNGSTLHSDGAAFDPETKKWTMLPPSPLTARVSAAAVWTGTELVIWGGYVDLSSTSSIHVTNTGAAYNPSTRTWRVLASSPLKPASSPGIAWTGREVVIVDGQPAVMTDKLRGERQAAAWDPATNHWHSLPREPAGTPSAFNVSVAHWADSRLLVFHGYSITGDPSATTVDSYDPATNRWTHLRKCDGAGYVGAAYDTGGKVLVPPAYTADGFLYAPQTNTWTPLPATPFPAGASALTPGGGLLVVANSGLAAVWNPQTNSWAKPPKMPAHAGDYPAAVGTGAEVLVWTSVDAAQLYAFTP